MRVRTFVALLLALGFGCAARAGAFDVAGKQPTRAQCVELASTLDPHLGGGLGPVVPPAPDIVASRNRVLTELTGDELTMLLKIGTQAKPARGVGEASAILRLRLIAGEESRVLVIGITDAGEVVLEGEPRLHLADSRWTSLSLALRARCSYTRTQPATAPSTMTLEKSQLVSSSIVFDRKTLKERFTRGLDSLVPAARSLRNEKMFVRLPRDMKGDASRIARGLVVYMHPATQSGVPAELSQVLDELSLICIAPDNVGNDRDRVHRMQLALDSVATAQSQYAIDSSRVYFVGLSGGGKICTHVWAAAPEVVQGVGAVVAIGSYEHLRRGDGKYWQGDFAKPSSKTLKVMANDRLFAITGDKDANQDYIRKALAVMEKDRLPTKLYDFADLGHEMPSSQRLRDAIVWLDEPRKAASDAREAASRQLLDQARVLDGAAKREKLREAIEASGKSAAAWEAEAEWQKEHF